MTVLLLGDITGRSRVALRMLSAVLEACGHEVLMLPTALISNTLNLGAHAALDTTGYLLESLSVWKQIGLRYDLAYVGYITGMEQAQALCGVMDELRAQGVRVVLDPILGDNGRMYNSVTQEQLNGFRLLAEHADVITPNMTEACLLAGEDYAFSLSSGRGTAVAATLRRPRLSVLVTSAVTKDGRDAVAGFDAEKGEGFCVPFDRVPGHHWGTGDLFTGLLMDGLLCGLTIEDAAGRAAARVAAQLRGEERSLLPEQ